MWIIYGHDVNKMISTALFKHVCIRMKKTLFIFAFLVSNEQCTPFGLDTYNASSCDCDLLAYVFCWSLQEHGCFLHIRWQHCGAWRGQLFIFVYSLRYVSL